MATAAVLPSGIYPMMVLWFEIALILSLVYWLVICVRAYKTHANDVVIFAAGLIFVASSSVHDILYNRQYIYSVYLIQYGVLIFIVFQSALLSLRYARTFKQNERLSVAMEILNKDLTQRNEDLVRLGRAREEFLSNVSHEMRTPLTTIVMNIEFLDDPTIDNAQRAGIVKEIAAGGSRLNRIIERMLLATELDTGKLATKSQSVSLKELIGEVVANTQAMHEDFQCAISGDAMEIYSDAGLMRLLFGELLSNVAVFGGGVADVGVQATESTCCITVSDQGPGIPENFMQKIGGKFERADQSITYEKSGTGLGLYIAGRIVALLGGTIAYKNLTPQGFEVTVTLPTEISTRARS